jgi:hypothetical protein
MSVAISGDTAVVGARRDDNASGVDAGSAYVYVRSGPPGNEVWAEQAKLIGANLYELAGSETGISVAISGDTALVGSWLWPNVTATGAAYVFVRSGPPGGEVWTQQAVLNNPQFGAYQYYGYAVALEGDTALIGSLATPGGYGGSAYFAARTGSPGGETWNQQQVHPSDGVAGDQFGNSVAMSPSQDTAVVGAWLDDNDGGVDAGSAYIFVESGNSWIEYAKLTASDGAADDRFGVKVAISGDTVVVGAYQDDDAGSQSGSAYVFTRSGTPGSEVWIEQAKLTASDAAAGDQFGASLALAGDTAVVGAYAADNAGGVDAGSAYVFTRSGATWTQQYKLTAPAAGADDWFGAAIALSGKTPVIGARQDDHAGGINAGSAYVFDISTCPLPGDCDLDGQVNLEDYAGFPACMSGPTSPFSAGCECYHLDGDADVDLEDLALLQRAFAPAP